MLVVSTPKFPKLPKFTLIAVSSCNARVFWLAVRGIEVLERSALRAEATVVMACWLRVVLIVRLSSWAWPIAIAQYHIITHYMAHL